MVKLVVWRCWPKNAKTHYLARMALNDKSRYLARLATIWRCWPLYGKARYYLGRLATIRRCWPLNCKARYLARLAIIWRRCWPTFGKLDTWLASLATMLSGDAGQKMLKLTTWRGWPLWRCWPLKSKARYLARLATIWREVITISLCWLLTSKAFS
jgi:hypothetical protein